jgi:hypothetical protein
MTTTKERRMSLPPTRPNVPFAKQQPHRTRPLVASLAPRDRKMTVLIVLAAVTIGFLAFGTPAAISASNTSKQISNGTDLQGCRSQFSAEVTDATTRLNQTRARSDIAQDDFLVAILAGDKDKRDTLLQDFGTIRVQMTKDSLSLDNANLRYQQAVTLSRTNPKRFLAMCSDQD